MAYAYSCEMQAKISWTFLRLQMELELHVPTPIVFIQLTNEVIKVNSLNKCRKI